MGLTYEYLTFNDKSSRDFDVWISGSGTFDAPRRDVESVSIPGKNGDLHIDNGRFENIKITYPAFITKAFRENFDSFKAFMLSQRGYKKLMDSYHPDYYRLASYQEPINPDMTALNRSGSFEIEFDCDPRRFLKEGEQLLIFTGEIIKNPTLYPSNPLIRAYGTGTLTVGDVVVVINSADGYTDLNCEIQEAYKGSVNCNNNITLTDGKFPVLQPGINEISFTGGDLYIAPNYWTV